MRRARTRVFVFFDPLSSSSSSSEPESTTASSASSASTSALALCELPNAAVATNRLPLDLELVLSSSPTKVDSRSSIFDEDDRATPVLGRSSNLSMARRIGSSPSTSMDVSIASLAALTTATRCAAGCAAGCAQLGLQPAPPVVPTLSAWWC